MRTTLIQYLDNFYRRGHETAYVHRRGYRTVRWHYRGIAQAAAQFARALEARQIGRGDRVLIWGNNCAEWVISFLGCVLRGVVCIPMDRIASLEFARRVCRQVEARLCVCSRDQARLLTEMPMMILEDLAALLERHSCDPYPAGDLTGNDTVQIVFTSGTTADPKGVVISHKNILANLEPLETEIQKYLKYERIVHPLRFLNLLPLSHVFGQFLGIFIPQLLGGTVIFHDSLNPSEIIGFIRQQSVSVLVAVPRMLDSMRAKIERDMEGAGRLKWFRTQIAAAEGERFLKRWWRFRSIHRQFGWKFWALISGGATLDATTELFWVRLGYAVIQGYGLTETTSLVSVNHPLRVSKGSVGRVLPGREMKLASDGEILVRGENIAKAYHRGKELLPVPEHEGWFHTGDVGEQDAQGNLYFKGRKKNVIVTPEGMNVFPEDLEAALRPQLGVRDCVVVGLDLGGNAEPCAVLLLDDRSRDPGLIVKKANDSLAEFQHMRRWFVWREDDFPRTPTQKPRMNIIQDLVQAGLGGQERGAASASTLVELIGKITGRPIARIAPEANLTVDLNLSSIDRVELLSALEDRLQVDLNESIFTSATTVGELERMMRQPALRRSDYHFPRWAQIWPVPALRCIVYYLVTWPATALMACPKVCGRQNLRGLRSPLMIISNHITQIDIGFILFALPLRYRHHLAVAMWGELLQAMRQPPRDLGFIRRCLEKLSYVLVVALFNVFPLPQQTGFRRSFNFAGECADQGYSIVVFPEGQRSQDGNMAPFRAGIGMLAKNLALPIVPMRIDGLFELRKKLKKLAPPGTVQVTIGSPVQFEADADPEAIARELELRVAELRRK